MHVKPLSWMRCCLFECGADMKSQQQSPRAHLAEHARLRMAPPMRPTAVMTRTGRRLSDDHVLFNIELVAAHHERKHACCIDPSRACNIEDIGFELGLRHITGDLAFGPTDNPRRDEERGIISGLGCTGFTLRGMPARNEQSAIPK